MYSRPLIIITEASVNIELLQQLISKFGNDIYSVVLRKVMRVKEVSKQLLPLCRQKGVFLLAHSDPINIEFCDGIHLNAKSETVENIRNRFGGDIKIGYSAHTIEQAIQAKHQGADYVFLSPVFKSKDSYSKAMGVLEFNASVEKIGSGVFALGGVNSDNVIQISKQAAGIACVSAIFGSLNPIDEVEKMIQAFRDR